MWHDYKVTVDIDELEKMIEKARRVGCIDVDIDFNPDDYDLVDEDDRPELSDMDTDDIVDELKNRHKELAMELYCDLSDIAQKVIEKSPAAARDFLTDILGLTHLASADEICNAIRDRL